MNFKNAPASFSFPYLKICAVLHFKLKGLTDQIFKKKKKKPSKIYYVINKSLQLNDLYMYVVCCTDVLDKRQFFDIPATSQVLYRTKTK